MRTEKPKIDLNSSKNLLVEHRETIREIFANAVRQAVLQHKRAGNPIAVYKNSEVTWVEAESIEVNNEIDKS